MTKSSGCAISFPDFANCEVGCVYLQNPVHVIVFEFFGCMMTSIVPLFKRIWLMFWLKQISTLSDSICDVPVSLWMTSRKTVGILPWGFLFRFMYVCAHVLILVLS